MNKIFFILFLFFSQALPAQVGFGDMITPPRVAFGIQKIRETEKRLGLNRKNHSIYFDYTAGKKEGYSIKTERTLLISKAATLQV